MERVKAHDSQYQFLINFIKNIHEKIFVMNYKKIFCNFFNREKDLLKVLEIMKDETRAYVRKSNKYCLDEYEFHNAASTREVSKVIYSRLKSGIVKLKSTIIPCVISSISKYDRSESGIYYPIARIKSIIYGDNSFFKSKKKVRAKRKKSKQSVKKCFSKSKYLRILNSRFFSKSKAALYETFNKTLDDSLKGERFTTKFNRILNSRLEKEEALKIKKHLTENIKERLRKRFKVSLIEKLRSEYLDILNVKFNKERNVLYNELNALNKFINCIKVLKPKILHKKGLMVELKNALKSRYKLQFALSYGGSLENGLKKQGPLNMFKKKIHLRL